MPHSFGYRHGTRHKFAKDFRKHGVLPTQTYLRTYRLGDIVDVVGDGAQQKGLPHKYYHGRTGRVWNVGKRSVGVVINKRVRTRIIPKPLIVRVEHVRPSRCREDFLKRCKANDAARKAAKESKTKVPLKRAPKGPAPGGFVKGRKAVQLHPLKYEGLGW